MKDGRDQKAVYCSRLSAANVPYLRDPTQVPWAETRRINYKVLLISSVPPFFKVRCASENGCLQIAMPQRY